LPKHSDKSALPDFEKLGAFYVGKRVDESTDSLTDDLVLYDSKDLTTHAVIIGMTGSGKTGLGISLLEEAAMDHIPVIAIDPKGDLGNLLLTFPKLQPEDFEPWVNPRQATDSGQTVPEFAKAQSALWTKGLSSWGQRGERIATMRNNVELAIYTPGSNAGLPVSVLQSFAAPGRDLIDDVDLYRERIQSTATGLLALLRVDSDPVTSREHILLSNLLDHSWQQGKDMDIASLITAIQNPPMSKIGVLDLDTFYPPKERFELAMRINNLLAAPGFSAWMQGASLNAGSLLYNERGKPRVSVMSIAHLDDAERMFFVSMLLNELIAWMRVQQGTTSLRAILYMDEIFGYMPPVENPPSKKLFLTLLKQARAYGLGLVLATQNPVDLDYRGLSNTGTWMIGRLQTERDKARVMAGLEGVSGGAEFDKQKMERTLAGLGKRRFLLHNVHEDEPCVFNTRWAMSYLVGPLTRDQIGRLTEADKQAAPVDAAKSFPEAPEKDAGPPLLPPGVKQLYLPTSASNVTYFPRLLAATDVVFSNARYKVDERVESTYALEIDSGPVPVDWDNADRPSVVLSDIDEAPLEDARYAELPEAAAQAKNYAVWEKALKRWIRQNEAITLFYSKKHKLMSEPSETEAAFRIRLQQVASEARDIEIAKVRNRYAGKAATLENRLLRAQQAIERESAQSSRSKIDTAVAVGTALLGAVLGRKRLSATTTNRIGSAIKRAGNARQQAGDVERAKQTAARVHADLEALNAKLQEDIDALETAYDSQQETLDERQVRPKTADIQVLMIGLAWVPYTDAGDGRLVEA